MAFCTPTVKSKNTQKENVKENDTLGRLKPKISIIYKEKPYCKGLEKLFDLYNVQFKILIEVLKNNFRILLLINVSIWKNHFSWASCLVKWPG